MNSDIIKIVSFVATICLLNKGKGVVAFFGWKCVQPGSLLRVVIAGLRGYLFLQTFRISELPELQESRFLP